MTVTKRSDTPSFSKDITQLPSTLLHALKPCLAANTPKGPVAHLPAKLLLFAFSFEDLHLLTYTEHNLSLPHHKPAKAEKTH